MLALIGHEREFCLRILGMDEEGGASIDVGTQQAQAFVSRAP